MAASPQVSAKLRALIASSSARRSWSFDLVTRRKLSMSASPMRILRAVGMGGRGGGGGGAGEGVVAAVAGGGLRLPPAVPRGGGAAGDDGAKRRPGSTLITTALKIL